MKQEKRYFDRLIYVVDGDVLRDFVSEHVDDMKDLKPGECEYIQDYILANRDVIEEDLRESIANCIEHYFTCIRSDFLADLEQGRREDDAYEKHRQKQIDGET